MIYILSTIEKTPGYLKIGYSKSSIENRLKQLQTGCPYLLKLVAQMKGSPAKEKYFHGNLKAHHIRGEWFHDNSEVRLFLGLRLNEMVGSIETDKEKKINEFFVRHPSSAYLLKAFCLDHNVTEQELNSMEGKQFSIHACTFEAINRLAIFHGSPFLEKQAIIMGRY